MDGVRKQLGIDHADTQLYIRSLIVCYQRLGQPAKAELLERELLEQADAELSKAIESHAADATLYRKRARINAQLQRWNEVLRDFTKALELNPADWGIWDDRGMSYLAVRQPEKAIADFTKSIAIDPKVSWLWQHRSLAYRALYRWQEAIADLSKTAELAPQNGAAWNDLAWLLATCPDPKLRDPDRALTTAKKAVELAPKEASQWKTLGLAHYRAREWASAIAALQESMKLRKGGDSALWFFLAMAHWQLDHKEEAAKWYAEAVKWMDKNAPQDEELQRFRTEAAELLKMESGQTTQEPLKK